MLEKILWVGALLILTATQAQADWPDKPSEQDRPAEQDEPSIPNSTSDAPSLEFLEFLGDWETADGQWTDPAEFAVPEQETNDEENEPKKN